MPLLDDRGRLFGRVNLIDAAVAVFVVLLVPLGYAAYVLFREPAPVVTTVAPRAVNNVKGEVIVIEGQHLRPFLRAFLGTTQIEYLFASPDRAKLTLPEIAAGEYELILFDEAREIARGGKITVQPPPAPSLSSAVPRIVRNVKGEVVDIEGQYLRPSFRAFLGRQRVEYLSERPDQARLTLPEMPIGVYELVLFDDTKEVARGGTISVQVPPPPPRAPEPRATVTVVGSFNPLDMADVARVRVGARFPATYERQHPALNDSLEVLAVRPPVSAAVPLVDNNPIAVQVADKQQVVALVRLQGRLVGKDFTFGEKRVLPGVDLVLPRAPRVAPRGRPTSAVSETPPPGGPQARPQLPLAFVVQRVYPERTTPVDVRVRLAIKPEVLAIVQRDVGPGSSDPFRAFYPQVLSLDLKMVLTGETKNDLKEGPVQIAEALVRFPAVRTVDGWAHENRLIRPGGDVAIETPAWMLIGNVLTMEVRGESGSQ